MDYIILNDGDFTPLDDNLNYIMLDHKPKPESEYLVMANSHPLFFKSEQWYKCFFDKTKNHVLRRSTEHGGICEQEMKLFSGRMENIVDLSTELSDIFAENGEQDVEGVFDKLNAVLADLNLSKELYSILFNLLNGESPYALVKEKGFDKYSVKRTIEVLTHIANGSENEDKLSSYFSKYIDSFKKGLKKPLYDLMSFCKSVNIDIAHYLLIEDLLFNKQTLIDSSEVNLIRSIGFHDVDILTSDELDYMCRLSDMMIESYNAEVADMYDDLSKKLYSNGVIRSIDIKRYCFDNNLSYYRLLDAYLNNGYKICNKISKLKCES